MYSWFLSLSLKKKETIGFFWLGEKELFPQCGSPFKEQLTSFPRDYRIHPIHSTRLGWMPVLFSFVSPFRSHFPNVSVSTYLLFSSFVAKINSFQVPLLPNSALLQTNHRLIRSLCSVFANFPRPREHEAKQVPRLKPRVPRGPTPDTSSLATGEIKVPIFN